MGKTAPTPPYGGSKPIVGGDGLGLDASLLEHLPQFREGEHGVYLAMDGVDGRPLLAHARTDEHGPQVLAQVVAQHSGHGCHGRDHRGEVRYQFGLVLAHVGHDSGAGRGDEPPFEVLLEQLPVGVGHQVGAQGDLMYGGEAQRADHGHQGARRDIGELGRKAGRHHGGHGLAVIEQGKGALGIVAHLLRVLRADAEAVTAADAARLDDAGLPVLHLDGLGRTFAHAGVAGATPVADDGDEGVLPARHRSPSPVFRQEEPASDSARSSSILATSVQGSTGLWK